jgi:hypothetical protein
MILGFAVFWVHVENKLGMATEAAPRLMVLRKSLRFIVIILSFSSFACIVVRIISKFNHKEIELGNLLISIFILKSDP